MPDAFSVHGADQFLALSKALKKAGRTDLRKELNKGVRAAAKPVIKDVKQAAEDKLPHGGGLNKRMAKARSRIATKTGRNPGVSVVFPGKQEGYLDGRIKHPVFAKKGRVKSANSRRKDGTVAKYTNARTGDDSVRWVTQQVDGDWFDGTVERSAPVVRPEIEKALNRIADQVVREAGG